MMKSSVVNDIFWKQDWQKLGILFNWHPTTPVHVALAKVNPRSSRTSLGQKAYLSHVFGGGTKSSLLNNLPHEWHHHYNHCHYLSLLFTALISNTILPSHRNPLVICFVVLTCPSKSNCTKLSVTARDKRDGLCLFYNTSHHVTMWPADR